MERPLSHVEERWSGLSLSVERSLRALYTSAQLCSLGSHSYSYCRDCLLSMSLSMSVSARLTCAVCRVPCGVYSDVVSSRHEELERCTQSAEMALDLEMENSGAVYTEPPPIGSLRGRSIGRLLDAACIGTAIAAL